MLRHFSTIVAARGGSVYKSRRWAAGSTSAPSFIGLTPAAIVLKTIKVIHTVVWAIFVACIFAIWYFAWRAAFTYAVALIGVVCVEVLVIVLNGWRCPLTSVAARYTADRRDNFDIYLPQWLARHNKAIFGVLYFAGVFFTIAQWAYALP